MIDKFDDLIICLLFWLLSKVNASHMQEKNYITVFKSFKFCK